MNYQTIFLNLKQSLDQKWVRIVLGWIIPLSILVVIYLKFKAQATNDTLNYTVNIDYLLLTLAVLLLPLNISLEIYKWKLLCYSFEQKTFKEHFKIILAGKSANVLTPFGLGDASTRILINNPRVRMKSLSALVLARITQSIPTFLFGIIASYFLIKEGVQLLDINIGTLLTIAFLSVLLSLILIWLNQQKIIKSFSMVSFWNSKLILSTLSLSFARFFVFSIQFYLIFSTLGITLEPLYLWLGIFWIFFIKSLVPNLSVMGDLVKRELSGILYFSLFDVDLTIVVIANFMIWTINMIIPTLTGSLFLSRFIKHRDDLD